MNYLEIVLNGFFIENNREYLDKYFIRTYKKAAKEHYFEADEFFSGCLKIIEHWEAYLQRKVFEQKQELYLMLNLAKNGKLTYEKMEGKSLKWKWKETINYCEQELMNERKDGIGSLTFTVHLFSLTNGRIAYNMPYEEVKQIESSIHNAKKAVQPKQTESNTAKLKVPQIALIHIFEDNQISEENASEIASLYGYTAKTSGKGLYQDYLKYFLRKNRIAKPTADTKKTLQNKISLFESILIHLTESAKSKASDEIQMLKTLLEEYS